MDLGSIVVVEQPFYSVGLGRSHILHVVVALAVVRPKTLHHTTSRRQEECQLSLWYGTIQSIHPKGAGVFE